jgi:hypothetical protein
MCSLAERDKSGGIMSSARVVAIGALLLMLAAIRWVPVARNLQLVVVSIAFVIGVIALYVEIRS